MLNQYSPKSEESDDQPLDFSKTSFSSTKRPVIPIKQESNRRERHHKTVTSPTETLPISRSPHQTPANCFTTPSPSPPEHNPNSHHTNQVLCQLLTGNLIPTSTGKLVASGGKNAVNSLAIQMQNESNLRYNGLNSQTSPVMTTTSTPNSSVIQPINVRHTSPMSPNGSESPIGLGSHQVDMHYAQSPNGGIDRFGTSGGLLTTASTAGVFAGNDSSKRSHKYNRPFKAYPRDPLASMPMSYYGVGLQMPLTADAIATQSLLATASDQAYLQFREQMLVSRRNTQEPRRPGQQPSVPKSTQSSIGSPAPEVTNNTNGNNSNHNNSNGNNNQNVYINNRSISPPKESIHSFGAKLNGSVTPMTPISTAPQINSDETLDYSNGHSSGNSSSGEADVGSVSSLTEGEHRGQGGQSSMRKRGRPLPEDLKDDAYWERRRKNNEAAKRSRDARRAKEDEIAIRAAFLEQENLKLRCEIAQLKTETTKLRCLLYNS